MSIFGRKLAYDRRRILADAARAKSRNKRSRAIALYRWVLAVEPANPDIHAQLAPLLAASGQDYDAWCSFRIAAAAQPTRAGGIAAYREATQFLPREIQAWQRLAQLLVKGNNKAAAVDALLEGSRQFDVAALRPRAISLLRSARTVEPWHFECVFELARHLARLDQHAEAAMLLEGLIERCDNSRSLRRIRGAQLRMDCSPVAVWRWLRAALQAGRENPDGRSSASLSSRSAQR